MGAKVIEERTRRPSIWSVDAPHSPRSHDFFGPVKANSSRKASSNVVRGSTLIVRNEPLTVILTCMRTSVCACSVYVFIMFVDLLQNSRAHNSRSNAFWPVPSSARAIASLLSAWDLRQQFASEAIDFLPSVPY